MLKQQQSILINSMENKFIFLVRHHLCDFLASLCDPPKDPNVQYHWQKWALGKRVGSNSICIKIFVFCMCSSESWVLQSFKSHGPCRNTSTTQSDFQIMDRKDWDPVNDSNDIALQIVIKVFRVFLGA